MSRLPWLFLLGACWLNQQDPPQTVVVVRREPCIATPPPPHIPPQDIIEAASDGPNAMLWLLWAHIEKLDRWAAVSWNTCAYNFENIENLHWEFK